MKNFFLALVALVLLVTSCKNSSQSPFVKKVGNYSVVTIEAPDLSGISDNGKEVLPSTDECGKAICEGCELH